MRSIHFIQAFRPRLASIKTRVGNIAAIVIGGAGFVQGGRRFIQGSVRVMSAGAWCVIPAVGSNWDPNVIAQPSSWIMQTANALYSPNAPINGPEIPNQNQLSELFYTDLMRQEQTRQVIDQGCARSDQTRQAKDLLAFLDLPDLARSCTPVVEFLCMESRLCPRGAKPLPGLVRAIKAVEEFHRAQGQDVGRMAASFGPPGLGGSTQLHKLHDRGRRIYPPSKH